MSRVREKLIRSPAPPCRQRRKSPGVSRTDIGAPSAPCRVCRTMAGECDSILADSLWGVRYSASLPHRGARPIRLFAMPLARSCRSRLRNLQTGAGTNALVGFREIKAVSPPGCDRRAAAFAQSSQRKKEKKRKRTRWRLRWRSMGLSLMCIGSLQAARHHLSKGAVFRL